MNLYSIDIQIVATAYIKADSEEEANQIVADNLKDTGFELGDRYQGTDDDSICIDGSAFSALVDNDEEIALSPAMTIVGPEDGSTVDLAEEDIDVDDD